jgi:hypothetical protein
LPFGFYPGSAAVGSIAGGTSLNSGISGVEIAGFFDNEWKVDASNVVISESSAK